MKIVVIACSAAVIAAGVVYITMKPAESPVAVAAPQASVTADCPQCRDLAAQVSTLQQTVHEMASREHSSSPPSVSTAPTAVVEPDPATRRAEAEQQRNAYLAGMAQSFSNERVDPKWSSYAASKVQATIEADDALRSHVAGIECRQQTCKVEIRDDGSTDVNRSLPLFAAHLGELLPSVTAQHFGDAGQRMTVLYMSSAVPQVARPAK